MFSQTTFNRAKKYFAKKKTLFNVPVPLIESTQIADFENIKPETGVLQKRELKQQIIGVEEIYVYVFASIL